MPLRSSSLGFGSASAMDVPPASHEAPENAKAARREPEAAVAVLARDAIRVAQPILADEQERDDERVDHERLDQREAENHRAADLAGGAGVAGDALERRAGGAALADAAAERGEADAEAGAERDQAVVDWRGPGSSSRWR